MGQVNCVNINPISSAGLDTGKKNAQSSVEFYFL